MFRDWYSISEESIYNNRLCKMFHPTNIELNLQKIYLLKRLMEYDTDQNMAWEHFKKIYCSNSTEEKIIDKDKKILMDMAISQEWRNKPDVRFYISKKEIKHINAIDAPREFKLFILGVLIYAKYIRQQTGFPTVGTRERSYAYYLTSGKDNFNIGKQRSRYINTMLSKKKNEHELSFYPLVTKIKIGEQSASKTIVCVKGDWIDWDCSEGHLITDLEHDSLLMARKIHKQKSICSNCGKKYSPSTKTQTSLCPSCYNITRHKNEAERVRRYREKQKAYAATTQN